MADETPAQSPLLTDRGLPIGNSQDVFIRRALHVKIGNLPTEPIPIGIPGTASFVDGPGPVAITPGIPQVLLTTTVAPSTILLLSQVVVVCRQEATFDIMSGAVMIGSGRTGAAVPQASFKWLPPRPISAGTIITVNFTARSGAAASSVEAYIHSSSVPI